MKKQMRIAAVTSAAALLAIGASFTSMAAQKGTWRLEDGDWYCINSDGDAIEDAFCLSNGKEFYVGDDGRLVSSAWVEVDSTWYYVNSAGEKVVNEWRFTTPAEDEEGDEEWFYLQSNGKRAESKKLVINGKTYYFDENGVMLTGWVQENGDGWGEADNADVSNTTTYFCGEDGARLKGEWVKTYGVGVDEDEADEDDMKWFYIKTSGQPAVGKQTNIKGETYFFNTYGQMLSGWVAGSDSNYREIWESEGSGTALSTVIAEGAEVYFCGDENDGHAKKGKWIKEWNSADFGDSDADTDKHWFYIEKSGKVYVPTEDETSKFAAAQEWNLVDAAAEDGKRFETDDTHQAMTKKINSKTYLFNQDGEMLYGFIEMDSKMYYFGGENDGERKTGNVTVKDEYEESVKAYFSAETKEEEGYYIGAGVNGAKNGKLYKDGILVTATEDKYEIKTVNGMEFIVNKSGSIQSAEGPYKDNGEELFGGAKFTYSNEKGAAYKSVLTKTK